MYLNQIYRIALSVACIGLILWFGKPFLIPVAYAFLISLVLYPLCRYIESKGLGKTLAVVIPVVLLCVAFAGLVTILSYEVVVLSGKWTAIHHQIDPFLSDIQKQLETEFGWTTEMQTTWLSETLNSMSQDAAKFLSDSINALVEALVNLVIIPIYVSLILIFRHKLVEFVVAVSPPSFKNKMNEVLHDTVKVFSRFIRGMVVVYLTVGVLNTIGLWIIGVENPLLYGMLSAIMTIIPYFGIIISAMLPMILSWIETGSLTQPIGIIIVFTVVQYLEANLIFPYVVGRYVNLNTLAAIFAIFLGALFWGVSGMILFLPMFAVIRLAASHFEELKPLNNLLGNK